MEKHAKVCLVRASLVRELEMLEDPIGTWLQLGRFPYQIVGVLADQELRSHTRKALALDGRIQEVYIPYATSMQTFGIFDYVERGGSSEASEVELDQIVAQVREIDDVMLTSEMVSAALGKLHPRKDWEVVIPLELLRQSEETQKVFHFVMLLIAAISLIVGGIGIANIMLATITERTREIGIRRALGARRRDVALQFLTETVVIALIGGLFGCLFGVLGSRGITEWTNWPSEIEPYYVLVALTISCTVGVLFGLWPARRAAHMDPIGALRHE
jgi:putative ABC transport system permease protein